MRTKRPLEDRNPPQHFADTTDESRIKRATDKQASVSLKESFDLSLFENPVWKEVKKQKWQTPKGISYSGQTHAHVCSSR